MNLLKFPITVLLIASFSIFGHAQTSIIIKELSNKHQKCLDSGVDMQGCSRIFSMQMDSMLNVVYRKLTAKLNSEEKKSLKKEQLSWLKKRDQYFKKQEKIFQKNFNSGEWGPDMFMITYQNEAEFVKQRVLILIKKLGECQSTTHNMGFCASRA